MIRLIHHNVTKAAKMWGHGGPRRRTFWFYGIQIFLFKNYAFGVLVMRKAALASTPANEGE